jgi:hypothetical protein
LRIERAAPLILLLSLALNGHADPACPPDKPSLKVGKREVFGAITNANIMPFGEYGKFAKKIPDFLQSKIGDGPDKISKVVLTRARALFLRQRKENKTKNVCYIAADMTRPHLLNEKDVTSGKADPITGNRLYLICESLGIFKALPVAHGGGIDLTKQDKDLNLKNGMRCAKNFGNVMGSLFTMGGDYLTGDLENSYKGKVLQKDGSACDYSRPFLDFTGEGETANADKDDRDIGAHPVILIGEGSYRCTAPGDPRADKLGYAFYSNGLQNYNGGRTEGCLGMPEDVATAILGIAKDHPMSIYVYPQKQDILDMASPGKKPYWNSDCLKTIGAPAYYGQGESQELEGAIKLKADQDEQTRKDNEGKATPRPPCPGIVGAPSADAAPTATGP